MPEGQHIHGVGGRLIAFASHSDIKKAGLLGERGLIVGKYGSRFLMLGGELHALVSAPTRSGKGVSIVIPNLLNWPESVVVLDIKLENWGITSGYRKKYGQACYLFNPASADGNTHRYNPLTYISEDINWRVDDVQKIAHMLYPDRPGTDIIWTASPRTLFVGIVLYLLETPNKPVTLGQVLRESLAEGDGATYFSRIIDARQASETPLSDACVRGLRSYTSIAAENTRSGIMQGFRSQLELWGNPLIDAATCANDFDLREVRQRRMSIYLGVTPDNLERMRPLLNLFFQQLIDLNTRELPTQNKTLRHTCLLLMDEFTALGKVGILAKGISYIAGYGLRMLPVIQSPAQLVEPYGKEAAQVFTTNHALQVVFAPKASETQTARDISEWLGYQTVKGKSESKGKGIFTKKERSQNESDQRRALLLPQEITSLGYKRQLIVMENVPPILAKKIFYYADPTFVNRLKEVSPRLHALGRKLPTKEQLGAAILAGELAAPVPAVKLEPISKEVIMTPIAQSNPSRPVTAEDIPNLTSLRLADFEVDFSAIDSPVPGAVDVAALHAYADDLCRQANILM